MKCKVDWCEEAAEIKYLCEPHYNQQRNEKKVETHQRILTKIETPQEYFLRIAVKQSPPVGEYYKDLDDCWIWPFITKHRYPDFQYKGVRKKVHQWSYELFKGPIGGLHVLHSCDVTRCFNPNHLRLGTHQDNMTDRFSRGR